jgi:hypothetical protein
VIVLDRRHNGITCDAVEAGRIANAVTDHARERFDSRIVRQVADRIRSSIDDVFMHVDDDDAYPVLFTHMIDASMVANAMRHAGIEYTEWNGEVDA